MGQIFEDLLPCLPSFTPPLLSFFFLCVVLVPEAEKDLVAFYSPFKKETPPLGVTSYGENVRVWARLPS